ncbi:TetR/AcrR family transcriptional regulator C-terminal domain-containing protein [Mycobacterium sp. M26]|uniref:TetR/AcrR family transcriptional regulator C-terminal domain-containing protein n=1 Tax=Mycobacterium sp. M26 TaxID=1762962 RepID=UPI0009EAF1FD|nr:TetR/AcrR family transcriptional regulator C-terminal domain-containing protein [Mycobacterium sp. M26]
MTDSRWEWTIAAANASTAQGDKPARRAKQPPLTEDQIVDAALAVIRSEGLDALSMRRLSRELGRSQMAAYWYVADKGELLDLVARRLLAEVSIPAPEDGGWDSRLRTLLTDIDARLHDHPGIAGILLERMRSTDRGLMSAIMEILIGAGFDDADVLLAYAMIHTYLFGRYQVVLQGEDTPDTDDLEDSVTRLLPVLETLRGRDFFRFGVDTIIEGLRARLPAR